MPHDIPPLEGRSQRVHVIIDTPAGSRNKYKYDPRLGLYRLSRILPEGSVFPYDFGSIPGTCSEDGDALDVLVLLAARSFPGCLVTVRLIGVLHAEQRESGKLIRNDRLIGVAHTPVNRPTIRDLRALDREQLHAIEHFFVSYNAFEGRPFRIRGRAGARQAHRILSQGIRAFARQARR